MPRPVNSDLNLYRAYGNNPVNRTDSTGQSWMDDWAFNFVLGMDVLTGGGFSSAVVSETGQAVGAYIDPADQFVAGFADTVTAGLSTKARGAMYGETATRNHEGGLFTAGQIVGAGVSIGLGFGGGSVGLAANLARGYTVGMTGYGMAQSGYNIATGQGSWTDALSFLPAAGRLARTRGVQNVLQDLRHATFNGVNAANRINDVWLLAGRGLGGFFKGWSNARTGRRLIDFAETAYERGIQYSKNKGLTAGTTVFGEEAARYASIMTKRYARTTLGLRTVEREHWLPDIGRRADLYWRAGGLNIEFTLEQVAGPRKLAQIRDFLSRPDRLAIITGAY